jgi:hypothetical protein
MWHCRSILSPSEFPTVIQEWPVQVITRQGKVPTVKIESFRLTFVIITANRKPVVDVPVTSLQFGF